MRWLIQWAFTSSVLILTVLAVRLFLKDKLAARLRSFYYYRAKRSSRSVYGGSVSGRTGADYQTFCMSTHSAYILS